MNWGTVSAKDVAEVLIFAGGVLWHFAGINARLLVLERLVQMLVARSGMTEHEGAD